MALNVERPLHVEKAEPDQPESLVSASKRADSVNTNSARLVRSGSDRDVRELLVLSQRHTSPEMAGQPAESACPDGADMASEMVFL
jgi:hypothetical protein